MNRVDNKFLYTEREIRQIEQLAIQRGISEQELMERAGTAAFKALKQRWPQAKSIVVFCGPGNNGGDGYVLARLAHQEGLQVRIRYVGDPNRLKDAASRAMKSCLAYSIEIIPFQMNELLEVDVIIDALLGIGLRGEVQKEFEEAIHSINAHIAPVLAIDLPSGLQAHSGAVSGSAVFADCTVTFIGLKQGLFTGAAFDYCGEIICDDLGLPLDLFSQTEHTAELIDLIHFVQWLQPRSRTAHKGLFGNTLIIGGDYGMTGAPRLAALGTLRVGAGLVKIATRPDHAALMSVLQPEIMSYGVKSAKDLKPLLAWANVVVIGPGLGRSHWGESLFNAVLKTELSLVIDADALYFLAESPRQSSRWILTPHPGEAAKLLNTSTQAVAEDRFQAITNLQKKYEGVCVLKGAGSLILSKNDKPRICTAGNPGMASGGMGDLLSGIIAGLLTQGIPPHIAAYSGVCVHAKAGDLARMNGGERGMIATDLLPFLRELVNEN